MERRITTSCKPLKEERELHINICMDENENWIAELYTNIHKYHNRCIKQGWEQISETVHEDGTWIDGTYRAPAKAISIGKANKPKRVMTEEQKKAAAERMRKWQQSKTNTNNENDLEDDEK